MFTGKIDGQDGNGAKIAVEVKETPKERHVRLVRE